MQLREQNPASDQLRFRLPAVTGKGLQVMKLIRAVMYVVCTLLVIAAVFCLISDLDGPSPDVVYAVDVKDNESPYLQTGLLSVMHGITSLRSYYHDVQTVKTESPGEKILVGTRAVNCGALDRDAMTAGLGSAHSLGYTAIQQVTRNRMPYEDYDALLRIVEAEATGGDVLSKLAIANVVLNRTKDSHFPDTISQVVWQRLDGMAQFSPVSDGRIYSVTITPSTIEAVERALAGEDNSQGALFFVARSSATKENLKWFDESLVRLFEYGGHEFSTFRDYAK